MNTIQQPAADVTITLITPKRHYQKVSGMRSFSNSLVSIMTPALATALLALTNMQAVIVFDLLTFVAAFLSLLFFVKIPSGETKDSREESLLESTKSGLLYLKNNKGILDLILFLAAINLTASMFNAAFPAMILSREGGGEVALGIVNAVRGMAMLAGSLFASLLPAPKNRVRVIFVRRICSLRLEKTFHYGV